MANTHEMITLRLLENDSSLYDDIIRLYADDVMRLCTLMLGHQHDAEEILQEALIKFVSLARAGKFRRQNGSIKGFLMVCAKNLCLSHLKKRSFHLSFQNDPSGIRAADVS